MVSIYLLVSMTLTGFQGPNPKQDMCGMALVGILLFSFGVNLMKFFIVAVMKTVRIIRLRKQNTVQLKP